ncbi:hypothetical protein EDB84DRAFT_1442747 [Lactarius hengduanensis]|nr:hypothetical protein EDB84DRAFT_1442747 [Lactarius hengduanensis]
MPGFENEPLQPSSLIAELFGTDLPGVFQLQGFESPHLTARPPGSTSDLSEDPTAFMANPTADELLAAISMLSPQENDDPLSSGSTATDALQAFNFDEYLQDFGGSAPPPPPTSGEPAPPGTHIPHGDTVLGEPREPDPNAVVLVRHDSIACLGGSAIPCRLSISCGCLPVARRTWLDSGSEVAGSPVGGLAARVRIADPQLRLLSPTGSRVTALSPVIIVVNLL